MRQQRKKQEGNDRLPKGGEGVTVIVMCTVTHVTERQGRMEKSQ